MQDKISGIFRSAYFRVFGQWPDGGAPEFFRHLSWIGGSFALAKVISSLVGIAAGRMLGPQEYGKISVFVSAGAAISPFLVAGLSNSVIKYGVVSEERDGVFTTTAAVFCALSCAAAVITVIFIEPLRAVFGIGRGMLLLSLAYAVASGAFVMASSMQQAAGGFKGRGAGEIAFSLLLASVFFLGILLLGRRYEAMACAYILAFGLVALLWALRLARHINFRLLGRERFLLISKYGLYSLGGGLASFFIFSVQSLILNAALSAREVGIYAAHYTATIGIAGYLGQALSTVLFPKASASTNRRRLWGLAVSSWKYQVPASLLFFASAEAAILTLMGRHQYGIDPLLLSLFAVCGTLLLMLTPLTYILVSGGIRGVRIGMLQSWGMAAVNFTACLLLTPRFGVAGAAAAFILTYTLLLLWLVRKGEALLE